MCYIVCPSCKKYSKVNDSAPLTFDKCENCGHNLEFAENSNELQRMLKGIEKPKISSDKRCSTCNSINPKETGICLFCGNTSFYYKYNIENIEEFQKNRGNLQGQFNTPPNLQKIPNAKISIGYRIFSLFIGITDFILFLLIGLELILGTDMDITMSPMALVTQHFQSLSIVIALSLLLSGLLSIFAMPKMKYLDSFKISSTVGAFIGIVVGIASKNIEVLIIGTILFGIITGIGGLIGELIIQVLTKKLGSKIIK